MSMNNLTERRKTGRFAGARQNRKVMGKTARAWNGQMLCMSIRPYCSPGKIVESLEDCLGAGTKTMFYFFRSNCTSR